MVESANVLGDIYLFAETGTVDVEKALYWYKDAASKGNTNAAYSIATVLYADLDATQEDLAEAFEFARMAAVAWDESAQFFLGKMYLEGSGTEQDLTQAYIWFDLAASGGVLEAHHYRAVTATKIGPEDSAKAHGLARAWFDENHSTPHTHRLLEGSHSRFE